MALRKPEQLAALHTRHVASLPAPAVFVESGTFHGDLTRLALGRFREVHTIELHMSWHADAVRALGPLGVRCYQGDSATWVPLLAQELVEPVFWFLDAHWFKRAKGVAGADRPLPLWAELEAIARRPYPDIVVVDDVHCFGTSEPTTEWLEVSLERIASYFPGHREAVILHDQAVVYR